MSRPATWLLEHRRNVHSQSGEDGVIEQVLSLIPNRDNWCVEFGAWDGLYLTNTRHLIESSGYSAVLIESSQKRYQDLKRNFASFKGVSTVNARVGFSAGDGLDHILSATPIPIDFDLLSIDIDGNDYHVWKAVSKYQPKVVIVEFNPTIPSQVHFVQAADASVNQGASLSALVELGKSKGYELVSVLAVNAFFVRAEYYPLLQLESNSVEALRAETAEVTYVFSGYDGTVFLAGGRRLPWHEIELSASRFQPLPRLLRKYPGNYTFVEKLLWAAYLPPSALLTRIRRILDRRSRRVDQQSSRN